MSTKEGYTPLVFQYTVFRGGYRGGAAGLLHPPDGFRGGGSVSRFQNSFSIALKRKKS